MARVCPAGGRDGWLSTRFSGEIEPAAQREGLGRKLPTNGLGGPCNTRLPSWSNVGLSRRTDPESNPGSTLGHLCNTCPIRTSLKGRIPMTEAFIYEAIRTPRGKQRGGALNE